MIGPRHYQRSMIDGLCTLQITQEYQIAHQHDDGERMDLRLITDEESNKGASSMPLQGICKCTWEWCWGSRLKADLQLTELKLVCGTFA